MGICEGGRVGLIVRLLFLPPRVRTAVSAHFMTNPAMKRRWTRNLGKFIISYHSSLCSLYQCCLTYHSILYSI